MMASQRMDCKAAGAVFARTGSGFRSFPGSGNLVWLAKRPVKTAVSFADRVGIAQSLLARREVRIKQHPEILIASLIDYRQAAHPLVFVAAVSKGDFIVINDDDLLEIVAFARLDREDESAPARN